MAGNRRAHWNEVYGQKSETEVSWFQETPQPSLDLLRLVDARLDDAIVDIGGGASRLVDHLLDRGFENLSVLDLSEAAIATARSRLGDRGSKVRWIAADVTSWESGESYDVWHDRAALHFLTDTAGQLAYATSLKKALKVGGHVIIGTFGPDGPEKCSGLPVVRYDAGRLAALLGPGFYLLDARQHEHKTPSGAVQKFQFCTFRRTR